MQNKITFKHLKGLFRKMCVVMLLALAGFSVKAQTITASGASYTGAFGFAGDALQTFVIENTNSTAVVLTTIAMRYDPFFNTNPAVANITLYRSSTSLSGPLTISAANWPIVATASGVAVPTAAAATVTVLSGMNIVIPANTTYRFAIESSNGLAFSYNATTPPTPNVFSAGGINLRLGNNQIAGQNIGYAGRLPTPLAANSPTFFTGSVTLSSAVPCTGTPAPGNTTSSVPTVCSAVNFSLSTSTPATPGTTGLSYQWQSSATGAAGSYSNITGATNATLITSQTAATYYQVLVTCAGGGSATSAPLQVPLTPQSGCYCTATATDTDPTLEKIGNVTFGGINNSSTSATGYENFTGLTPVSDFIKGGTYSLNVTGTGTYDFDAVGVWIDFNQNGNFTDPGENVYVSSMGEGPYSTNVTIPAGAVSGNTRMRIRIYDNIFGNGVIGSCGAADYGQVEDYTLNIIPCVPLAITSSPTDVSVGCGGTATFTVGTTGSLPSYIWEYRATPTSPWLLVPNAAPYSGVNTATLTVVPDISMNGYQYRAAVSGACTGPDVSGIAKLTVTTFVLPITPATYTKCLADPAILISAPSTQFTVSATNNTTVTIDDNVPTAATSTNVISGVPAGANIVQIDVKFTLPHTYCGDMVMNLKAPNGQIIALNKYLGGTGNQAGVYPNIGYTNTVISSAGITALSSAASQPITGTFKADMINAPIPGPAVQNPTGFVSAATAWSQLASSTQSPNGTWTLAMADGGNGDVGILTSWTLTITYGGAPATMVLTPSTGLFTNAAGTTAYTGTAVTQVYAAPAANTTYSAVVTAGACATVAQTIQVNVNTPIGGTATLTSRTVCVGDNTTFTPGGTLTGGPGFTYQWQVSTPTVPAFANIAGATASSFTVSGATAAQNGNKYRLIIGTGGNCGAATVTSSEATLTVNPTPVVVISVAPIKKLFPGITTTLTAAVSPNAAATYQWLRDGVAVPGATSNKLIVGIDGLGAYTVRVTDVNGCTNNAVTTPPSISISDSATSGILFIYPSPNSGRFQVRYYADPTDLINTPAFVNVYDSKGQRVFTRRYIAISGYTLFDVDLASHGKGIYRVELTNSNRERIKTGSVMVF